MQDNTGLNSPACLPGTPGPLLEHGRGEGFSQSARGGPLRAEAYWLPKGGHLEEEYEDAFALAPDLGRVAIADGASETSFARRWARALAEGCVAARGAQGLDPFDPPQTLEWLGRLQQEWYGKVEWSRLRGLARLKASLGACSSLLAVEFTPPEPRLGLTGESRSGAPADHAPDTAVAAWTALAFGDSCLFLVRGERLIRAFPLEGSSQFTNSPLLLSANPEGNENLSGGLARAEGTLVPGDLLILATDALAAWFLSEHEQGGSPWRVLLGLRCPSGFADWVVARRGVGGMRDDDTTLILVECQPMPVEPAGKA